LAITLLGAFLLTAYGEGGSSTKLAGLFVGQLVMWPVFLAGYHFRFTPVKRNHKQRQRR